MSNKTEELIEKSTNTGKEVTSSKRTIKLPSSATEKKKQTEPKTTCNVISIDELKKSKDTGIASKKSKRTLRLGIGKEEVAKVDDSKNKVDTQKTTNTVLDVTKDKKTLIVDKLIENENTSSSITPNTIISNPTFLEAPSIFEKFDISNKTTSASSISTNNEPTINLNSSFFYTPSVFAKYNIEVTETDVSQAPVAVILPEKEKKVEKVETIENVEETNDNTEDTIINQNVIKETPTISLNDIISIDDESESIDDILGFSFEDNNENVGEPSTSYEAVAGNIEIPTSKPQVGTTNVTSIFKKFSYDEADLSNSENNITEGIPVQLNNSNDIKQVLGNSDNNQQKKVTDFNVTADSIGISTPIIENDLDVLSALDPSTNYNSENDINILNILSPEQNSSTDDIDINDVEIDNKKVEENTSDEDFSIEDYFGIENQNNDEVELDETEENTIETTTTIDESEEETQEELLDDNADIEFDEELSSESVPEEVNETTNEGSGKFSKEELSSLSKLFGSLTDTISSLSNRISELENTKIQPIEKEEILENNVPADEIIEPVVGENTVDSSEIEQIGVNETEVDESDIGEAECGESKIEVSDEDISLDDISIEDLEGIDIEDVTIPEETIEGTVQEISQGNDSEELGVIENGESEEASIQDIDINDISLEDIDLDDIDITEDEIENELNEELDAENPISIEDILSDALSSDTVLDSDMKDELLSEVLSTDEIVTNQDASHVDDEEPTSDFLKIIESLSKTISELEQSSVEPQQEVVTEVPQNDLPAETSESKTVETPNDGKTFNILINKDDIFSISILNETYEIVADFDGISVLSENIHISTPKNNFFVKIGEKYIEIHNYKTYFLVYTNFEDVEFANAINNVAFAKKNNKIELNIKEAFKLSSVNNKIELSMLSSSVAGRVVSHNASNNDGSICDNKTLVISEETQKVYLPYTIEDVVKKLNDTSTGYQTMEEVIDKEYTLPLSDFKMPIISRFREAYRFMRTKEKSSVYAALDLALELMFNSNLNPAVIRAAKDLKELNIYLDCLYENELDKFDCFKIIYKVLPKIQ